MCVAHNNGGFSLFDVNFLFSPLLSWRLLSPACKLHLSLLEGTKATRKNTSKGVEIFDKLMLASILLRRNLHPLTPQNLSCSSAFSAADSAKSKSVFRLQ